MPLGRMYGVGKQAGGRARPSSFASFQRAGALSSGGMLWSPWLIAAPPLSAPRSPRPQPAFREPDRRPSVALYITKSATGAADAQAATPPGEMAELSVAGNSKPAVLAGAHSASCGLGRRGGGARARCVSRARSA